MMRESRAAEKALLAGPVADKAGHPISRLPENSPMPNLPSLASLKALTAWDTPTICNALEITSPERRARGFTRRPVVACFPEMQPVVAFARTALIRSREPHPRDRDSANRIRLGYYESVAAEPLPSIAVIQDIDSPDTGFGA